MVHDQPQVGETLSKKRHVPEMGWTISIEIERDPASIVSGWVKGTQPANPQTMSSLAATVFT
jgi:hypothetical protein